MIERLKSTSTRHLLLERIIRKANLMNLNVLYVFLTIFNSHYNSVRPTEDFEAIIRDMPPGQFEDEHIQQLNSQENDRSLNHILSASRKEFEKNHAKDFDEQMKEAMKESIDDMVTKAVETESLMTTFEENEMEAAKRNPSSITKNNNSLNLRMMMYETSNS
eukprot:TRINITY_DN870_c0_g1_i1.p1 TRINITY_DN870_c0_g1~~TRINITY_DN870_c0_g1_i1.p1  ORF type:complete len:162 (+),score=28.76 TRINITY_DN870_c0_g1_i1:774-1259(+)